MDLPISDAHLHLWDNGNLNYPWLNNEPALNQAFLLTDLMNATKNLHVENFVFIQSKCETSQALAEAVWVSELAERDARIHAIVAHAMLEQGKDVREHLLALSKIPLVRGVRRPFLTEANDFCLQQKFIDGVNLLSEFNFSFDISTQAQQLPAVIRLVQQCQNVKFILDHMGKPNVAEKQRQAWEEQIKILAGFPNVWCKISGLITEVHHQTWRSEDFKPYILHAVQEFGFERVMFGSDWPTLNLAGSYAHWVHTLYDILSHYYSKAELKKLFYENTWRCYAAANAKVKIEK